MADSTGPALSQGTRKQDEDCLTELSAVPVNEPELDRSPPIDLAAQAEESHDLDASVQTRPQLSSTSFEFGLNRKYQKIRADIPLNKQKKPEIPASCASELDSCSGAVDRKRERGREPQDSTICESRGIGGRPGKTILDRLMSFVAKQLKKLEQMILKALGVKSKTDQENTLSEEEEEALELMTLQKRAERASYLATQKQMEKKRRSEQEQTPSKAENR